MKKAVVIGGTGATGKALLNTLSNDLSYQSVVALSRRDGTSLLPKVEICKVDFNHLEQSSVIISGDVAFSCLGTTLKDAGSQDAQWRVDYDYQYTFAKIAKESGISTLVLISSMGADKKSPIFYSKMKGKLEEAITELNFPSLIILRPSLLIRPETKRLGERISLPILNTFNKIGLLKKYQPISVEDLSKAMVKSVERYKAGTHILELKQILELV
ncbi:NAD(P)H-binding protein [Riemerella anatipestifer]|nr:NAD(P)H-binding protein [Riemerella anatipestifer]MDY3533727.1 NAD(P)H-binding protein [Riemerella anatipestifer]MDY3535656.1 NAD(P)H-binding protein [Riemerella anatipestifer]